MKNILKLIGILSGLAILAVIVIIALMPWMDRWGATDAEIASIFPGDELVLSPKLVYNRAVTIQASPEQIYPWIVQLGAEKGGYYSYTWLEATLQCSIVNADRIHAEWQDLEMGDLVKMCPGDFGPLPWEVAIIKPNQVIVMGHRDNGEWVGSWHFILVPQADGATRLILRSRDTMTGGFWDVIRPGVFIMERGMLLGIKERTEGMVGK